MIDILARYEILTKFVSKLKIEFISLFLRSFFKDKFNLLFKCDLEYKKYFFVCVLVTLVIKKAFFCSIYKEIE